MAPVQITDWVHWPLAVPGIELPASVITVVCTSSADCSDGYHADLFAVLSMVASNIEAGVGIKTLRCWMCAAYAGAFEDEDGHLHLLAPSEAQLAAVYRPVCRALHGLESLDVSPSTWCDLQTIAEVVAAAPDLRALTIRVDVVGAPLVRRAVVCGSLSDLTVRSVFARVGATTQQRTLELDLEQSIGLETCEVQVDGMLVVGDRATMVLECYEGADINTHVCGPGLIGWELHCDIAAGLHAESMPVHRQVTVSFQWGQDKAWASEVQWKE